MFVFFIKDILKLIDLSERATLDSCVVGERRDVDIVTGERSRVSDGQWETKGCLV